MNVALRARDSENMLVGEEIVRHRYSSRVIHWSVAVFMLGALFTGLPIWTPIFGWMAFLFGGLSVCRWLHPWLGILFAAASAVMFIHWFKEMRLEANERDWLGPKLFTYLTFQGEDPEVGKYNGGQKILFFAASLGALFLLLSGIVLWLPMSFSQVWREVSWVVHDLSFILFTMMIIGHIYLGTAAEPGTFGAMTRGTVTKQWARLHHPRWYREVTGEEKRRP
jgi:formate dehydrogenase subunit gamma